MRKIQLRDRRRHQSTRSQRGSLSSLSQQIIGNLYQALTGNVHTPAYFLQRALANGLPSLELEHAIRSARTMQFLPDYLLAASEQKFERAVYWDELGLKTRARDLYLESSLWAVYAELLIDDEERRHLVWQKYRQSYRTAAPYFAHPTEEVSIQYLASNLSGYFRMPECSENRAEKVPVVILLNGLFSPREEQHYLENSLLAQGFATLCVDYPGIGPDAVAASFDVRELGNSLYMYLTARSELDCSRISLYGVGVGGRMAIYLALVNPERFCSVVSMSTPLDLMSDLERLAPVFAREHMISPIAARAALYELALQTPIEQDIERIECPFLVVGGGKDKIAPADETQMIFERSLSADKKLIFCPGAGHCLYEMMPSLRYEIAQWINQRA